MESANLHHHHQLHQDHQLLVGSSTLAATPCLGVGNNHALSSNLLFLGRNSSSIHTSSGEVLFRDLNQRSDVHVHNALNNSNLQELGCHSWLNNNDQYDGNNIKGEINSDNSSTFPKFTDLLNSGNLSSIQENDEEHTQMNDLSEKLLLKTLLLSPNYHVGNTLHPTRDQAFQSLESANNNVPFSVGATISIQGNASQIYPTVNISSLRNMSSGFPGSIDVNLQALDLFSMDRSSVESDHPMDRNTHRLGEDSSQLGFTGIHQYSRLKQSVDPDNIPSFNNNVVLAGPKRPNNIVEPKAPPSVNKRSRSESRTSCPPFKVRKEKLGDRIAALQQLVAPFGKTDTASVLMEAIGYIKFLQNQVETLSLPYMKLSSGHKSSDPMQEGSDGNDESKPDLRSQGLCLVPISCMSYITNDGGGGIWPPHPSNFNPRF